MSKYKIDLQYDAYCEEAFNKETGMLIAEDKFLRTAHDKPAIITLELDSEFDALYDSMKLADDPDLVKQDLEDMLWDKVDVRKHLEKGTHDVFINFITREAA